VVRVMRADLVGSTSAITAFGAPQAARSVAVASD